MHQTALKRKQALLLSTAVTVSLSLAQSHAQTFNGNDTTNGPFSSGVQTFNGSSVFNANAPQAIGGGIQNFNSLSTLNATSAQAVTAGIQSFNHFSTLNAKASDTIAGGFQNFYDATTFNALAKNTITGGNQFFNGSSILNVSAAEAIGGGTQTFGFNSTLNAAASRAVIGGFQIFQGNSRLNAKAANAVNGGTQTFDASSLLSASVAHAVSGGTQWFNGASMFNASADNAVSGGTQWLMDNSVLNALTANAVNGGMQSFYDNSMLNAKAAGSVSSGTQTFNDDSTLNASVTGAVSGGTQWFTGSSLLNVSAANAVSGGNQWFVESSTFNALVAGAITHGELLFNDNSILNASVAHAISGGSLDFWGSSVLNVSASDAVSGGSRSFRNTSALNVSAVGAFMNGTQVFYNDSSLNVLADNALSPSTGIEFDNVYGGAGGILRLNGYSTAIGSVSSLSTGSGVITNGAAADSTLTVDVTQTGSSVFSGLMEDGGSGLLTLELAGGTLTLAGTASHTGGTIVSGGILLVGDETGTGTLGGTVYVGSGGTLGGAGLLSGPVTVDGMLATGSSPSTLTFDDSLTLNAGAKSVFEFNSPGVVGGTGLGGNDLVVVNGTLTLGGTLKAEVAAAGYYRLFNYGTLAAGSVFDDKEIVSSRHGFSVAHSGIQYSVPGQVNLVVLGTGQSIQFWDGANTNSDGVIHGGTGTWQGLSTNWKNETDLSNAGWAASVGVFSGTAGTVSVQGSALFDTLQFSTDGYRIEGDRLVMAGPGGGVINVDGGVSATVTSEIEDGVSTRLYKAGEGKLILEGTKSYTGGTRLLSGTLSVSQDESLGERAGELSFNGGLLQVAGTSFTSTNRAITLDERGGGFDIADAGNSFMLSQDIVGNGALYKLGGGTLELEGANSYGGGTRVVAGTLIGSTGSIAGDISSSGTVIFDQVTDAVFAGDIGGFGTTKGQVVKRGNGELALGGVSGLNWTVEAGRLVSTSDRFAGNADIVGSGLFVFDQTDSGIYTGVLSGSGQFSLDGTGTILLTGDSSAFTGTTTLNAGTLVVGNATGAGKLGGSFDVLSGARLGGSGTVGSGTGSTVTITSGGVLSPGGSIGALTVNGNLVFEKGSRFEIEVNPNGVETDLVAVKGSATLNGGSVAHIGANGSYDLRSTYTILSTDGALSGKFDDVTSNFAFLTPELIYDFDAGEVDLRLSRNDTDFVSVAWTRNQIATAGGIESIGSTTAHPIYDAIAQLPDDQYLIRASFDALSGEIHGSAKTAMIEDSRFIRNAANDRMRAAFADTDASFPPVLAYGPGGEPVAVGASHVGPVFWTSGFGSWGASDSDGNAASVDRDIGGLLIGGDTMLGDWRLGALGGYSHSTFEARDRASSGSTETYHLGLYGGTNWSSIAFRTGLAYSWHDLETKRSISIPGLSEHLVGDYRAFTFQAFGEFGYGIGFADRTRLEPFANLAHVHLHSSGFGEKGGDAALSVHSSNTDVTFTTLGLRGEHGMTLGAVEATLRGMIGWRHAFGDTTPESTHAFSAGNAFTIAGAPIARNAAVIEGGIDLAVSPNATFGISYQGQLAGKAKDHGFRANLGVKF